MGRIFFLGLLVGCSPKRADTSEDGAGLRAFPDTFMWGAAMAAFQVDAGCPTLSPEECEDPNSDWYQWVTDPELIANSTNHLSGDPMSKGPGHWELYPEDFAAAADELNLNTLRVSIEWSRLFPNDPGDVSTVEELAEHADMDAVTSYRTYFDAMRAAGLEPMVTLNHYTLPLWIHDGKACNADIEGCENRGWADPERMVAAIGLYSGFCAMTFGDQVDLWATLNEPFAVVLAGYMLPSAERTNPPGVVNPSLAIEVAFALAEGHGAMYRAVHEYDDVARVGGVPNLVAVKPSDPDNVDDIRGAEHLDYVYNRAWLNAAINGDFDRDLDGVVEETRDDMGMDFIGVNYYTRITAKGLPINIVPGYDYMDFYPEVTWEEYNPGLGEVARLAHEYGLPVMITEMGTPEMDGAAERMLIPALDGLLDAIDDGVEVEGFYFWSLIDNYEWNHGMDMRFGLYSVDTTTKVRTITDVGLAYGEIAATNALP
jgi:beta-galactosidase